MTFKSNWPFRVEWRTFSVAKAGSAPGENEDAAAPLASGCRTTPTHFRCAVSDGATTSAFSREWAQSLVAAYRRNVLENELRPSDLLALRQAWNAERRGEQLPWYLEEKVLQGGFASLLGLTVRAPFAVCKLRAWEAVAVGDTCLFHLRGDRLLQSFPLTRPEEFDDRPLLLSSNLPDVPSDLSLGQQCRGLWEPGDCFLLMTDALAAWFLMEVSRDSRPWEQMLGQHITSDEFESLVSNLRNAGQLRNDDTTLLSVRVR